MSLNFIKEEAASIQTTPRKAVQISTSVSRNGYGFSITALCDDGSIWLLSEFTAGWEQLPVIPFEDKEGQ